MARTSMSNHKVYGIVNVILTVTVVEDVVCVVCKFDVELACMCMMICDIRCWYVCVAAGICV